MVLIPAGAFTTAIIIVIMAIFLVLIAMLAVKNFKAGNINGVFKEPMLLFALGFLSLMGNFLIKEINSGEIAAIISHVLVVVSIILNSIFIVVISKQIKKKKRSEQLD